MAYQRVPLHTPDNQVQTLEDLELLARSCFDGLMAALVPTCCRAVAEQAGNALRDAERVRVLGIE